ncbi:MAG: hypothetical protein RLY82_329 [Pseudomonadota bacterium]
MARDAVMGATPANLATSCKVIAPELRRDFLALEIESFVDMMIKMVALS